MTNIVKHRLHVCLEGWSWTALGGAILGLGRGGEDELAGGVVGPRAVAPVGDPHHPDCDLLTTPDNCGAPASCLLAPAPRKAGRDPDAGFYRAPLQNSYLKTVVAEKIIKFLYSFSQKAFHGEYQ